MPPKIKLFHPWSITRSLSLSENVRVHLCAFREKQFTWQVVYLKDPGPKMAAMMRISGKALLMKRALNRLVCADWSTSENLPNKMPKTHGELAEKSQSQSFIQNKADLSDISEKQRMLSMVKSEDFLMLEGSFDWSSPPVIEPNTSVKKRTLHSTPHNDTAGIPLKLLTGCTSSLAFCNYHSLSVVDRFWGQIIPAELHLKLLFWLALTPKQAAGL